MVEAAGCGPGTCRLTRVSVLGGRGSFLVGAQWPQVGQVEELIAASLGMPCAP